MIIVELPDDILELGQDLSGNFRWTGNKPPKAISLKVSWRTEGRGTVDTEAVYTNSFVGETFSFFSCKLPALGPISYDGQILRIIWEVTAEAEFSGFLGKKVKKREEREVKVFRVIPRGA
ncbi:MAG: hypothetical protein ACRC8A_09900 [Microcoleaceae cyanobacterium]